MAWAFLIEFYLDRSVKRPVDLQNETAHSVFPVHSGFESQPAAAGSRQPDRRQLEFTGDGKSLATRANGALEIASPTSQSCAAFALRRLARPVGQLFRVHQPHAQAQAGGRHQHAKGAGVSTISAGLAASLSETGDGRVLLVDMNRENGAAQQFVRGKAECKLDDALVSEKRDNALVQENLYVVSEGAGADNLPRILPKRFASLVPKLKASDYDYIIFDMPPVTPDQHHDAAWPVSWTR